MRYLLIWELNPEQIQYFSIPDWEVESERWALESAHGKMLNCDEDVDGAIHVASLVQLGFTETGEEDDGIFVRTVYIEHPEGRWAKYMIDVSELPNHPFVGVFKSGFIL